MGELLTVNDFPSGLFQKPIELPIFKFVVMTVPFISFAFNEILDQVFPKSVDLTKSPETLQNMTESLADIIEILELNEAIILQLLPKSDENNNKLSLAAKILLEYLLSAANQAKLPSLIPDESSVHWELSG